MTMDRMKTFAKYALMAVGIYIFTTILVFVGFNLNYKDIKSDNKIPEQISIEKAEATSTTGRIYGYVTNLKENNVNEKYIKVEIYNNNNEKDEIQYLKIDNVEFGEKKMFKVFFKTDNAKHCTIDIVDNEY